MKSFKLTINHDRILSHYVELHKGDTIIFKYKYHDDSRIEWVTEYEGMIKNNRKKMYKGKTNGMHTLALNLFECVEIDTSKCETFEDYYLLLKKVFEDETIPYKDIYSKSIKENEKIVSKNNKIIKKINNKKLAYSFDIGNWIISYSKNKKNEIWRIKLHSDKELITSFLNSKKWVKCELWKPKEFEFCVFWQYNDNSYIISQYISTTIKNKHVTNFNDHLMEWDNIDPLEIIEEIKIKNKGIKC